MLASVKPFLQGRVSPHSSWRPVRGGGGTRFLLKDWPHLHKTHHVAPETFLEASQTGGQTMVQKSGL